MGNTATVQPRPVVTRAPPVSAPRTWRRSRDCLRGRRQDPRRLRTAKYPRPDPTNQEEG